jgi:hypothetical protein
MAGDGAQPEPAGKGYIDIGKIGKVNSIIYSIVSVVKGAISVHKLRTTLAELEVEYGKNQSIEQSFIEFMNVLDTLATNIKATTLSLRTVIQQLQLYYFVHSVTYSTEANGINKFIHTLRPEDYGLDS